MVGKNIFLQRISIGIDTFGASGPFNKLYEHFGLTDTNLLNLIKNKL